MAIKKVKYIVFRRVTDAEFFHINKPAGIEIKGGGQSYIDVPTTDVTPKKWQDFFGGLKSKKGTKGPYWTFPINSLGITPKEQQKLTIGQRRDQSFNIRAQKITSKESNRVLSWHPSNGFPSPKNPSKKEHVVDLVVYIVKTYDGEFWAGWYQKNPPYVDIKCADILASMIDTKTSGGFIEVNPEGLFLDTSDKYRPFSINKATAVTVVKVKTEKAIPAATKTTVDRKPKDEEATIQELFAEDENYDNVQDEKVKKRIQEVRTRNTKAAKLLKELYGGKCQISGDEFEFKKKNGDIYSEVHHLIPLSEGGADSPFNLIVVNPLIHKMLHYAEVSGIDLSKISHKKLAIVICGKKYIITWHPKHSELIEKQQANGN
jgi:5-methylcytosine-specific restriction enzyme A